MCRLRLIATSSYRRFVFAAFIAGCREVRSRVSTRLLSTMADGCPTCGRGAGPCVVTCQDRIPLIVGHVGKQFTADLEASGQRIQFIGRTQVHQDWETGQRSDTARSGPPATWLGNSGSIGASSVAATSNFARSATQ